MNRPSVTKIAGSDNITIKGFKTALTNENISPANKKPTMPTLTWMLS
jgi:hypothetical protein